MVYCPLGQTHKQLLEMNNSRMGQGCQHILTEYVLSLTPIFSLLFGMIYTNASYPRGTNFLLPGHFIHSCLSAEWEKDSAM